ncbi:MAG: hypothetical protein V3S69_06875 [Dehalococcoidales bacterium]
MNFARNLKQEVTHWPVTGSDGYGGFTFGPPVTLVSRWEEKVELFITPGNEEAHSRVVAYFNTDIGVGDFMALGDLTATADPGALNGQAFRVRNYSKTTDLRNLNTLRKVWL